MLTYDSKYWMVGARRIDLLYERLFHYEKFARKRMSLFWLNFGAPFLTGSIVVLLLEAFVLRPPGQRAIGNLLLVLGIETTLMALCLTLGFLAKRQENRPFNKFSYEKSFALRLILTDSLKNDRKSLWKNRHLISKYLVQTGGTNDTVELGTTLSWRQDQLAGRAEAKAMAQTLLVMMGLPVSEVDGHAERMSQDLRTRELQSVNRCLETYSNRSALHFAAALTGQEPEEIIWGLERVREQIQNGH